MRIPIWRKGITMAVNQHAECHHRHRPQQQGPPQNSRETPASAGGTRGQTGPGRKAATARMGRQRSIALAARDAKFRTNHMA